MELSIEVFGKKIIELFGKKITVSIGDEEASDNNPNNSTATKITLSLFDQTPHQELDDDDRQHVPPGSNKAAEDERKRKKIATFRDEVDAPSCFLGLTTTSRTADVVLQPQPPSQSSSSHSADGTKKRKSSSDRPKQENYPQVPSTDLSSDFLQIIGETVVEPVFLYRKKLTGTDVSKGQNRLLVTEKKKLVDEFLTEAERVVYDVEKPCPKIDAFAVDGMGREYHLHLSKWKKSTVFIHKWGDLLRANGAKTDDWVDLWGFRRQDNVIRLAVNFVNT